MTYTADDFARAAYARRADGCRAVAHSERDGAPARWVRDCTTATFSDAEMAEGDWTPVRECSDHREDARIASAALAHARRIADDWKAAAETERARAEKAEKELDEARTRLAGVTIPVPDITITDEMVRLLRREGDLWASVVIPSDAVARALLTAALTEPPKRPGGAEEIESVIRTWDENGDTNADHGDWDNLADFLASRGVRVVTEDGAR